MKAILFIAIMLIACRSVPGGWQTPQTSGKGYYEKRRVPIAEVARKLAIVVSVTIVMIVQVV